MIKIDKLLDAISNFLKDRLEQTKGDIINKISSIIAKLISFFSFNINTLICPRIHQHCCWKLFEFNF